MIRLKDAVARHDRLAEYYRRIGKTKAMAKHMNNAAALRTAQKIRREMKREKAS